MPCPATMLGRTRPQTCPGAYIVMAYVVMAYVVMACRRTALGGALVQQGAVPAAVLQLPPLSELTKMALSSIVA